MAASSRGRETAWESPGQRARPGSLEAVIVRTENTWNAELRIDLGALGGVDEIVGLSLGHYGLDDPDVANQWPYQAEPNVPETWGATVVGHRGGPCDSGALLAHDSEVGTGDP